MGGAGEVGVVGGGVCGRRGVLEPEPDAWLAKKKNKKEKEFKANQQSQFLFIFFFLF